MRSDAFLHTGIISPDVIAAHVMKMQILNPTICRSATARETERRSGKQGLALLLRHCSGAGGNIPVVRALSQRPIEQSARLPAHIDDLLPPGLHAPLGDDAPGFRNIAADGRADGGRVQCRGN
jgi:hypothetical protein